MHPALLLAVAGPALAAPSPAVFAFFYSWYQTPEQDGSWKHWDHSVLEHWLPSVRAQYPGADTRDLPPHDIHAPFYPASGPYSSRNASHLRQQLRELKAAGVTAIVASWWGRAGTSTGDSQGVLTGDAVALALEAAACSASTTSTEIPRGGHLASKALFSSGTWRSDAF